jgi:hypothetical protein
MRPKSYIDDNIGYVMYVKNENPTISGIYVSEKAIEMWK